MHSTTTVSADDTDRARLEDRADFIRTETIRLIEIAKTGHYSSVFSAAEIFAALYYSVMDIRPDDPGWADRDRFVIGKGHAAVGMFAYLADLGYFPREELDSYARLGSPYGDHPDMTKVKGIDFSSGSIGHALSNGFGMALAGRMSDRDYTVFAMLGDGEMQEGQVWEAAMSSAHHRLDRLVAIVDRNGYQLDGAVDDVLGVEALADKWRAFGWNVIEVDGHDVIEVRDTLNRIKHAKRDGVPTCVIAHTQKGKGVRYMEEEPGWHLGYLDPEDAESAIEEINNGRRAR
ncbi:transketolase [Pseudoclavibacter sp. JAI123]|uniref:transketolase n=1 Tax=Pseudoclavibacter sp. JAI123 TaxID=2723065 RepID=UPI0015CA88FF|nr:transketolase [Pseudoclavibacter sp. JAI123]NYF15139.1 transketolase [Pseudoclavibacter sp. JAI123]